jgi:hypothetical protein
MKRNIIHLVTVAILTALTWSVSQAGFRSGSAEEAISTSVEGVSRVALSFDIEGLADFDFDAGQAIYLEWDLTGVPSNARSEYAVYGASGSWDDASDIQGMALSGDPVGTWDIEIRDYERAGGFVRFDVTSLVRSWIEEEDPNHGLVITTSAVSANTLGAQLDNARIVVR